MTAVPVALTPDVRWLNECYVHDDGRHEHVAVYLVGEAGTNVLVDSGSFHHREAIERQLESAIGDGTLDAIVLSHSDYPHSANIAAFRDHWPGVELIASSGAPAQQGLPAEARKATIGGDLEVAGHRLSFIDPPLADRSHTTWIFDHGAGVLYTADGFGSLHDADHCDRTSRDFAGGIGLESIRRHHRETLPWLRYADPGKLRRSLEAILEAYDPEWVAPIHGHPIHRDDRDRYLERLLTAVEAIHDAYAVPE